MKKLFLLTVFVFFIILLASACAAAQTGGGPDAGKGPVSPVTGADSAGSRASAPEVSESQESPAAETSAPDPAAASEQESEITGAARPEPYTLPFVQEETVLTFATHDNLAGTVSYADYLPAWVEFTKRTGIKIDFQVVPQASYNENIQTRLAAGISLPDFLMLPPDPMQYADSGVIIPIDGYIDQYAPNIVQLFKDKPDIKSATTAPDGHIYYICNVTNARAIVNYETVLYRKDWFEELGLTELVSLEDWHAFLTAARDGDLNGNGDEIPLTCQNFAQLRVFAWAFGLKLEMGDSGSEMEYWQIGDDDKVGCAWTDPLLKDWLVLMNKWYGENLIDKDVTGDQPSDKFQSKATENLAAAAITSSMWTPQWTTNMQQNYPGAYWEVAYPPKGPSGTQMLLKERPMSGERFAVSKDCKNPELTIKAMDYMYANREGQLLVGNCGIEGVSYTMVDGKPKFTPMIADDPRGDGTAIWEFGSNGPWPKILMRELIENRFFHFPQSENARDAAEKYQIESFPYIIATKEENQKLTSMLADITTYRKEMIVNFITGKEPIDNFNVFVSTLEDMGIGELIALKQAQYDRVTQ
jgi:putative aldouronate transport system substrate-binding protein